jgi:D-tyrosyl-tRNA(Tyr) deacylase
MWCRFHVSRIGRIASDLYGRQNRPVRAVVQRVRDASVTVGDVVVAEVGAGLVVLLGVAHDDSPEVAERLAGKIARLRVFGNEQGRFDRSLAETGGAALVVSQFTLIADTRKGNRPSFADAARPEVAEPLYEVFCGMLEREGVRVARGIFGARMEVALVNDGPVTVVLDA